GRRLRLAIDAAVTRPSAKQKHIQPAIHPLPPSEWLRPKVNTCTVCTAVRQAPFIVLERFCKSDSSRLTAGVRRRRSTAAPLSCKPRARRVGCPPSSIDFASPHRLVRPRTQGFHPWYAGSNPAGDASILHSAPPPPTARSSNASASTR